MTARRRATTRGRRYLSVAAKPPHALELAQHRRELDACLDGLTEEQARRSLVGSRTTLLGLVKHASFVERVWFEEAFTGRSRAELGLVEGPDESFVLEDGDTIESVRADHRLACERSREAVAGSLRRLAS